MRQADHRAFNDAGQGVDRGFDLAWIDVEAAADNEVLGAPDDVEIAVRIDPAEIAGDKISIVAEFLRGFFGALPIARKDIRPFDLDDAGFALRQNLSGLMARNAQGDARKRKTNTPRPALAVIGVRADHIGFRRTV